ncbi:MAG: ISAs1 family transposase [Phormidesmis sp. RL_2_1]|nr:ISAs1 family transposase [Phormidesmis sp. RL_2_1]
MKKLKRSLHKQFESLADPRVRQPEHLLLDIVAIAILAVISGADDMVAVETYGKAKAAWLKTFLALPNGIPSHDTFSRVLALIDPQSLQECFLKWVQQLTEQLEINLINIDGKTARGSYDRAQSLKALHTVSAWACEHHLVLAQQRVESKSNEITAIPELLNLLDISGAIITLDAMGTQRAIATQIIEQGGDYILALKGNQGSLHKGVKAFFEAAEQSQWAGIEVSHRDCTEAGHHRIEHRQVWAVPLSQLPALPSHSKWQGLSTVVMVKRERQLWNKTTTEVCFYITSLAADAALLARAIRCHWGIENSLHWVLDVTFQEDQSRIRKGHGPENIGLLRRLSLNLLKREPSKQSLRQKRYRAAMDNDFLVKVLLANGADEG